LFGFEVSTWLELISLYSDVKTLQLAFLFENHKKLNYNSFIILIFASFNNSTGAR